MLEQLVHLQRTLGPIGSIALPFAAGIVLGALCGILYCRGGRGDKPSLDNAIPKSGEANLDSPTEPLAIATSRDKRRLPRRSGHVTEVYVARSGEIHNPQQGLVINRSPGGLGLLLSDAYPVGTVLGVLPVKASEMTPWVEVEVKNCRPSGDDWEVGVQFLKVPPYSTMLLFG